MEKSSIPFAVGSSIAFAAGISGDRRMLNWMLAVENYRKAEFNLKKAQVELQLFKAQLIIAELKCDKPQLTKVRLISSGRIGIKKCI